jgi:hypothetical protein
LEIRPLRFFQEVLKAIMSQPTRDSRTSNVVEGTPTYAGPWMLFGGIVGGISRSTSGCAKTSSVVLACTTRVSRWSVRGNTMQPCYLTNYFANAGFSNISVEEFIPETLTRVTGFKAS